MHIFVLHNQVKTDSYAEVLFQWLLRLLSEQGFTVTMCDDKNQITKADFGAKKTAVVLYTARKELSFFSKITLQTVIKKIAFNYCVQVTDAKPFSSGLRQLIISNDINPFVITKLLSSVFFAVASATEKQKIAEQNIIITNQLKQIAIAAQDEFQPITWSEQQAVKMQYTQGREYFFTFAGNKTETAFTDLLKAFSTFKNWQHSSMKLVVTGELSFTETEKWKEKISTYRFREDVVWLDHLSEGETIRTLAGAYAFVHTPDRDNDVLPLLQAIKCETACLSFTTDAIKEYAGESIIQIEPNHYDELAEKMILLYKDEALRNHLIAKGKEVSQHYTKEKTCSALAEALSLPLH